MHFLSKPIPGGIASISLVTLLAGGFAHASNLPALPSARSDQTDLFKRFIGDDQFTSNFYYLDRTAGASNKPTTQPWSGSYWPLQSGGIADPYNVGGSPWLHLTLREILGTDFARKRFEKRMSKIRDRINDLDSDTVDEMSPAEKYDLYLGDRDFSLTYSVWQSISEEVQTFGRIKLWEGSCQGWSTASIYSARPTHAFKVMSLDGRYLIPFYPDDVKALATLLWANSLIQDHTTLLGSLCTSTDPEYDPRTGKVLNTTCQGVNPGDFHVAILEMIGNRHESFVVNRTNNTQVWNQPIAGYELEYFNPYTDKKGSISESLVSRNNQDDIFARYRAPSTQSLIGVKMKLKYSSETKATHKTDNAEKDDNINTLSLKYDLELDGSGNIIGGEWRGSVDSDTEHADIPKFPGFIWKFDMKDPHALSIGDFNLPDQISAIDRQTLISLSKKASQFRYNHYKYDSNGRIVTDANGYYVVTRAELKPQPFSKVVNQLVDMAK